MKLYLQFGHGMMEHARVLSKKWGKKTAVVLSPRDLTHKQLTKFGPEMVGLGAEVLLDPQIYIPATTDHVNLTSHAYWPKSPYFSGPSFKKSLDELIQLNISIGAERIIIPGEFATNIDASWLKTQQSIIHDVNAADLEGMEPIYTIALSPAALINVAQVHLLLDNLEKWSIKSVYLILKHPDGNYLIDSSMWLANALDLAAGMKLGGLEVIVGYCSHQKLILAIAGVDAICSGTWMNVRAFCIEKFIASKDMAQRSTWYFAPHLLSEYKIDALDIAFKQKVLAQLKTPASYGSSYADQLFIAPQPSLASYDEQDSFRHYLQCLKVQVENAVLSTYQATLDNQIALLDYADTKLKALSGLGVSGQQRDLQKHIIHSKNALAVLNKQRGAILSRKWPL